MTTNPRYVCRCLRSLVTCIVAIGIEKSAVAQPAVEAVDFHSQKIYQPSKTPHYAAWVSFFPGHDGRWYLGCEEVSLPDEALPQTSPQKWHEMALPVGYDKSQHLMEAYSTRHDVHRQSQFL
jgi:hypothetical protein